MYFLKFNHPDYSPGFDCDLQNQGRTFPYNKIVGNNNYELFENFLHWCGNVFFLLTDVVNASLDSMVSRDILEDAGNYTQELKDNEETPSPRTVKMEKTKGRQYPLLKPKKNPHNDTHISPSDPDAKMSVKTGKAMTLNYLGQVSVGTASHMITHIQAFMADKSNSQCLPILLPQACN
ncbi:MAG TPA: hypothetical protein VN040_27045 [Pseudosphingobacterium sp.]|nr:hypothetical protein [Pseudosphingobacterium sp.]